MKCAASWPRLPHDTDDARPMVKLEVLICTTAARLSQLAPGRLPMLPEVRYIVVCQNPDGANTAPARAALARRHDIEVYQFDDRGLSVNRNHALDLATAPYIHIADDDLRFKAEGLRQIIAEFDADPSLDVLCTHAEIPEEHIYPPDGWNLAEPYRFYSPVSFEISLRRRAVESVGLRFSPLFGIGAPFLAAGEENIFLHKALSSGLSGRFRDICAVVHPGPTTCTRDGARAGVIRARGAVMRISRGSAAAFIRLPVEAWRSPGLFVTSLWHLLEGFVYSIVKSRQI